MNPQKTSLFVKKTAHQLGFDQCGISKAGFLEEEAPRLEAWLNQGMHGEMAYMANHFDKRPDPAKLVEGAKSVISLIYNYYPQEDLAKNGSYRIAKYAYGNDYHHVLKPKLKTLLQAIQEEYGEVNGRVFVDSAPVHERAWAAKSGIGWIGKNSLLLNKTMGSFFFLAEVILDLEMTSDTPTTDHCGTCTKCIDACPTDAIPAPYVVDGSKCISYFTIELKNEIPAGYSGQFEDWIFGCDICQDVCPWNRFSKPHQENQFEPHQKLDTLSKREWQEMTQDIFSEVFKGSAVKRTKYAGLRRNIQYVEKDKM